MSMRQGESHEAQSRLRPAEGGRPHLRHRDLCSNCDLAEACGNRTTRDRPIFFCELFEISAPASPAPAPAAEAQGDEPSTGKHGGLCANCENAETCTFDKPEGGVWHCEEYA